MEKFRVLFWLLVLSGLISVAIGWFLGRFVLSVIQEVLR